MLLCECTIEVKRNVSPKKGDRMKVGELTDKLREFDRSLDIHCWCEDDDLIATFDIIEVQKRGVVRSRDEKAEKVLFSFQEGENSNPVVILEVTTDF